MLSDEQLLKAWAHMTTAQIKAMKPERGPGSKAVNDTRKRVVRLREKQEAAHAQK